MLRKYISFALLACYGISIATAQPCVPDLVEDIYLDQDAILNWSPSDNCPDTQYFIRIETDDGVIQYEYILNDLDLDVSFLIYCKRYIFTVSPVADNVMGLGNEYGASISPPSDLNIIIQNFTADQIDEDVLIQWHVEEQHRTCVAYFHIHYWNEDSTIPQAFYVGQTGFFIEHVAQCMNYGFEITAYYLGRNGSRGDFNFTVPEMTNTPSLIEISQDPLTINTTWRLERYSLNRCKVTALYVNGTRFNATYDIDDTPERPDVQVSIGGLHANSMYYFNVSVENSAGVSEAFQLAVQTLPIDPTLN